MAELSLTAPPPVAVNAPVISTRPSTTIALFERTEGETGKLLEHPTVGAFLESQVRGVNDAGEGRFSPIAELTVARARSVIHHQ